MFMNAYFSIDIETLQKVKSKMYSVDQDFIFIYQTSDERSLVVAPRLELMTFISECVKNHLYFLESVE